jgi:hypothetical protein
MHGRPSPGKDSCKRLCSRSGCSRGPGQGSIVDFIARSRNHTADAAGLVPDTATVTPAAKPFDQHQGSALLRRQRMSGQ